VPNYLSGAPAINGMMMYFGAGTTDRFVKVLEKSPRQGAWLRVPREEGWREWRIDGPCIASAGAGAGSGGLRFFEGAFGCRVVESLRSLAGPQIFCGPSMSYGVQGMP
jgi:hypothetical protein